MLVIKDAAVVGVGLVIFVTSVSANAVVVN